MWRSSAPPPETAKEARVRIAKENRRKRRLETMQKRLQQTPLSAFMASDIVDIMKVLTEATYFITHSDMSVERALDRLEMRLNEHARKTRAKLTSTGPG